MSPPPLTRLWELIGPPEHLPSLPLVRRTLIDLEPYVANIQETPEWLKSALSEVVQLAAVSVPDPPIQPREGGRARHPLHGYITEFPVYAALCDQPKDTEDTALLRRTQAILLTAAALQPEAASSDYQSTVQEAGLCVRRFDTNSDLVQCARQALLMSTSSLDDIKKNLDSCISADPTPPPDVTRHLSALARLISYAREASKPPIRTGEPSIRILRRSPAEQEPDSSIEPDEEYVSIDADAAEQQERGRLGASPVGESPPRRHASIPLGDSAALALSDRDRIIRAKTRARAMATAAQLLPFASDKLQRLDIEALQDWLATPDLLSNSPDDADNSESILLVIMLLTGSDLHRARNLQIVDGPADVDDSGNLCLILNPLSWCLPGPKLNNAFHPESKFAHLYRPTSKHLTLPVPTAFPGVERLLAQTDAIRAGTFFSGTDKSWERRVRDILSKINRHFASRLTPKRIADFLSRAVNDTCGDRAEGSLFHHFEDSTGSAARLYYYAPRLTRLITVYQKVWNWLDRGSPLQWSWSDLPSESSNLCIGSAGCPLDDIVRQMVADLTKRTMELSRGRRGLLRSIQFHNQFTAYTAQMTRWTAALRAVNDPVEVELIDPIQGLLAVSEKDSESYSSSRVIPLPKTTLNQLRHYSEHRGAFLAQMDELGLHLKPTTWMFFVNDGKPVEVTPTSLLAHTGVDYLLQSNSQRHFLRTRLRELGVPGSYVDALLGHGAAGEESYGRYSCFSPIILARHLRGPLGTLVTEMGWKPIHGIRT